MTLVKLMGLSLPVGFREGEFEPGVKGVFLKLGRPTEKTAIAIGKGLLRLVEGLPGNKEVLDAKYWVATVVAGCGKTEFWLIADYTMERLRAFLGAPTPKPEEKTECECPLCQLERTVVQLPEHEARLILSREGISVELQNRIIEIADPKQFASIFKEVTQITIIGMRD